MAKNRLRRVMFCRGVNPGQGRLFIGLLGNALGASLLDQAEWVGADVIVTGANYQSRLCEMTPGGVTGYLLRNATHRCHDGALRAALACG
jgi:hypothetical protein